MSYYQQVNEAVLFSPPSDELVDWLFRNVFRTTLTAAGFALLSLPETVSSPALRQFMVTLKQALSRRYYQENGQYLVYASAMRFDQQVTTRFHLDGGPEESYLMLGYEPTPVQSHLAMADFSRAAQDAGLSPKDFLNQHNPMFSVGAMLLTPYITTLDVFDPRRANILLVNNSCLPLDATNPSLGVLHQGQIPVPIPEESRVINSMMLLPAIDPLTEWVTGPALDIFLTTDSVSGKD